MVKAKAFKVGDKYRSDGERAFAVFGPGLLKGHSGSEVSDLTYEPETFNLPGGRYTPDFRAILDDGTVCFIEIKASKHQKGYRDARSKLRAAQELNQFYVWLEVRLTVRKGMVEILNCEIEVIE